MLAASRCPTHALIASVRAGSPADDAGFSPGCYITSVDGHPLRDVIDWRWLSGDFSIEVGYIDADGDTGTVELERDLGEDWGIEFDGLVFDDVIQCRNACTFCFMHQL
ncbi:MAG: PDZ domain-containing protein, partial [Berryella intestinalis]|nr:PDZ domain-containing protein [Berryella intestinalis]